MHKHRLYMKNMEDSAGAAGFDVFHSATVNSAFLFFSRFFRKNSPVEERADLEKLSCLGFYSTFSFTEAFNLVCYCSSQGLSIACAFVNCTFLSVSHLLCKRIAPGARWQCRQNPCHSQPSPSVQTSLEWHIHPPTCTHTQSGCQLVNCSHRTFSCCCSKWGNV